MANKNFEIKNGLTVAGTERITSAGVVTGTTATQSASDNTTKLASTAYVTTALANLADSAPSTLNTLNELAAALGDDASFSTTVTNSIATKLPLAGGTMSGNLTITKAAPIIHMRATGSGSDSELKFQTASNGRGMYLDESDSNKLKIYDGSGKGTAGEFTIDNTGQVGIGTTSPAAKLDVSGVFQFFDDTTPEIKIIDSDDSNYALLSYSDGTINLSSNHGNESGGANVIKLSTGGTERMRVNSAGVTVTGQTLTTGGAVSAPSYSFIGDGDTGISRPTTNALNLVTAGAERVRVHANGRVSIGVATAQDILEIRGVAGTRGGLTISNTNHNEPAVSFARNSTATARMFITEPDATHTSTLNFQTSNASGGPNLITAMTIDQNQKVGIGTTTPAYSLHIKGAGHQRIKVEKTDAGGDADISIASRSDSTGWVLFTDSQAGANSGVIKYVHNGDYMSFRTNGTDDRIRIASNGAIGIGGANYGSDGQVLTSTGGSSAPAWEDAGGGGSVAGIVSNANATAMTINSSEQIGIGTTSPAARLHVKDTGTADAFRVENFNRGVVFNGVGSAGMYSEYQVQGTAKFRIGQANHLVSSGSAADFAFQATAGNMLFSTGTTERMRLSSTGKVHIGNTFSADGSYDNLVVGTGSGNEGMTIYGAANGASSIAFADPNDNDVGSFQYDHSLNTLLITAGTQALMRFGSGAGTTASGLVQVTNYGNVGIGRTPQYYGSNKYVDMMAGANGAMVLQLIGHNGSGGKLNLVATTTNCSIITENNGPLAFGCNQTEYMRLDNTGEFLINRTDGFGTGGAAALFVTGRSDVGIYVTGSNSSGYTLMSFHNGGLNQIGSIKNSNNNATTFNTSSDYRLKENVDYTWDATTRLKQLKPARFNWISDDSNTLVDGFMAHEVSSIIPEAIEGSKDATEAVTNVVLNAEGNVVKAGVTEAEWEAGKLQVLYTQAEYDNGDIGENSSIVGDVKTERRFDTNTTWEANHTKNVYQSIDHSKLVPLLVKALQEADAKIEALTTRIETLEG